MADMDAVNNLAKFNSKGVDDVILRHHTHQLIDPEQFLIVISFNDLTL